MPDCEEVSNDNTSLLISLSWPQVKGETTDSSLGNKTVR